jgi:hypothetical protein
VTILAHRPETSNAIGNSGEHQNKPPTSKLPLFMLLLALALIVIIMVAGTSSGQSPKVQSAPASDGSCKGIACPTASATAGLEREDRYRQYLKQLGYGFPYGETDREIQKSLGISRAVDFLAQLSTTGEWLVAESKGNKIGDASIQIKSTIDGLLSKGVKFSNRLKLQIVLDATNYNKITNDPKGLDGHYVEQGSTYIKKPDGSWLEFAGVKVEAVLFD